MGDDFRVGFAAEGVALTRELFTQIGEVFDYAVVDDGDVPRTRGVGMCVGFGWPAVRRPARVSDSARSCQIEIIE